MRIWAGILCVQAVWAHDPITTKLTWSKEISRVVYARCLTCHRPNGSAFSLATYDEARPWAKGIRDEVLNRRMPPWDPVKGVGDFRGDASLSLPELDLIVNWVEGGAPEGEPAYLPQLPRVFNGMQPETAQPGDVRGSSTLTSARILRAIRPSGPAEVAALLPGGEVRRLLWIRKFHKQWNRTYWLRTPERLPRGTQLIVTGDPVTIFW